MTALALLGPPPRLVDPGTPVVRADDLGLLRGESVFETLRIAGGRARLVPEHLARMARSAARLGLELPGGWEELAALAVEAYGAADGSLRLVWTSGGTGFALCTAITPDVLAGRQGVSVATMTLGVAAGLRADAPWLLGGVKATSYAVNMATLRAAAAAGAQDAIWVSSDGFVLEAPTATVAWVRDGVLVTPDPSLVGTLPGTTLAAALSVCPVAWESRLGTAAELAEADEVMLLSSVRGVAPVVSLDGRALGVGPVTTALAAAFEELLLRS